MMQIEKRFLIPNGLNFSQDQKVLKTSACIRNSVTAYLKEKHNAAVELMFLENQSEIMILFY